MELDESTSPFSCDDISNFHKLAQENGSVFTTKSFVVSRIGKYDNNSTFYTHNFICED